MKIATTTRFKENAHMNEFHINNHPRNKNSNGELNTEKMVKVDFKRYPQFITIFV